MKIYNIETEGVTTPTVIITLEDLLKMVNTLYCGSPSDVEKQIKSIQEEVEKYENYDMETKDNTNV